MREIKNIIVDQRRIEKLLVDYKRSLVRRGLGPCEAIDSIFDTAASHH
jgi:hypothetical protein